MGGDLNCILAKLDCTNHHTAKMSPSLARLVNTLDMSDAFRTLHPTAPVYSHFYHNVQAGQGATRIDRAYFWGDIKTLSARYEPIAFSDHMTHIVSIYLQNGMDHILSPKARALLKVWPEVIQDSEFQSNLSEAMSDCKEQRNGHSYLVGCGGQSRNKEVSHQKGQGDQ